MNRRKAMLVGGASVTVILAVVALVLRSLLSPSSYETRISMGVLRYAETNDLWFPAAVVGLTNLGSITLRYDHAGLNDPAILRVERQTGWSSVSFHSAGGVTVPPMLLKPGSHIVFAVPVPEGTLRWQLMYPVRSVSFQDRMGDKFTGRWGDTLYKLSGMLSLTNEGPLCEFWSEVFEVSESNRVSPVP
jgi:hypothetical protein